MKCVDNDFAAPLKWCAYIKLSGWLNEEICPTDEKIPACLFIARLRVVFSSQDKIDTFGKSDTNMGRKYFQKSPEVYYKKNSS